MPNSVAFAGLLATVYGAGETIVYLQDDEYTLSVKHWLDEDGLVRLEP